jgi:DNA-binding NarL/FixJ family response regulator
MHVLIVDDHPLYREGVKALLMGMDPTVTTCDAGSVDEALALAGQAIDLVLLDMNLPGVNRVDAIRSVKAVFEHIPVVVLSAEEDPRLVRATIEAGAAGYVPKGTDINLTMQALRVVLARGIYLPAHLLLPSLASPAAPAQPSRAGSGKPQLSEAQQVVFQGLLRGESNKVIARKVGIAEGTVKAHLWSIYQLLGVNTRTQAMYRAHELGWFADQGEGRVP